MLVYKRQPWKWAFALWHPLSKVKHNMWQSTATQQSQIRVHKPTLFLLSFGFYGLIQFIFIKTLAYVQQNRITELETTSKIIWSSGSQISLCIRTFCRAFEKYKIWGAGPDLQARFFGDGTQEPIYLKAPRPGLTFRKGLLTLRWGSPLTLRWGSRSQRS